MLDRSRRARHYFRVVVEPEAPCVTVTSSLSLGRARLALWLALLRVCAVLLVGEFSGLAHTGLDVFESLNGIAHHDADDCDDEQGHECPPGCPNCHCWHAAPSIVATQHLVGHEGPLGATVAAKVSTVPYAGRQPAGADPRCPYRPPRGCAFASA